MSNVSSAPDKTRSYGKDGGYEGSGSLSYSNIPSGGQQSRSWTFGATWLDGWRINTSWSNDTQRLRKVEVRDFETGAWTEVWAGDVTVAAAQSGTFVDTFADALRFTIENRETFDSSPSAAADRHIVGLVDHLHDV